MELPILRDGDLTLRPPRPEDADAVTAACQDREIQRWTRIPSPYRREHAVEYLAGSASSAEAGETASYLGFDAEGRLVASASIMDLDHERGTGEIFVHPANVASQRVAERAGFTATGERRPLPRAPGESDETGFIVYLSRTEGVGARTWGS